MLALIAFAGFLRGYGRICTDSRKGIGIEIVDIPTAENTIQQKKPCQLIDRALQNIRLKLS